jgi:type III secretion protein T
MNLFTDAHLWLFSVLLSTVRLFPAFILIPWLGSGVLTGVVKFPLAFLLGASLWQFPGEVVYGTDASWMAWLLLKEAVIGLVIAIALCFPYWVMHAAGSLIDNQRGATLSSTLSPTTGIDTSELANFFNLLSVVIILESGGLMTFVETFHQSYKLWSPAARDMPPVDDVVRYIGVMMSNAVKIAAPVITVFLAAEICLGLLSRYAPQMNAFSLALVIKSSIGFFVLLLYLAPAVPSELKRIEKYFLPLS